MQVRITQTHVTILTRQKLKLHHQFDTLTKA